uniref:Uncharacterized protein n=1 Tax=Anguilla anguilla TaxID=7936 RepID=A0A0E9UD31_ANGAN
MLLVSDLKTCACKPFPLVFSSEKIALKAYCAGFLSLCLQSMDLLPLSFYPTHSRRIGYPT